MQSTYEIQYKFAYKHNDKTVDIFCFSIPKLDFITTGNVKSTDFTFYARYKRINPDEDVLKSYSKITITIENALIDLLFSKDQSNLTLTHEIIKQRVTNLIENTEQDSEGCRIQVGKE